MDKKLGGSGMGKDYIFDTERVEVLIKWAIDLPCIVSNFDIEDHPLHVRQTGNRINFNIIKKISKKLFDDLKNKKPEASGFVVGYINKVMPRVNKELLSRKYIDGHVLLHTFSTSEIKDVFIADKNGEFIPILWPLPVNPFPPLQNKLEAMEHIFIRDLIDAMTYYFTYNYDESIRKIITSLENYFIYYKIKVPKTKDNIIQKIINLLRQRKDKFLKLVNYYIVEKNYGSKDKYTKILRENIKFIYLLRNKIVHDKLRLMVESEMICKKGLKTLLYIYQSVDNRRNNLFDYIFSLDMQFSAIISILYGTDLDDIEESMKEMDEEKNKKDNMINGPDDLNDWIFGNLKITKKEKDAVLISG